MKLNGILEGKRKDVLERWFRAVADTYAPQTSQFLRSESDRFANPVGFAVSQGLAGIFDSLLAGTGGEAMKPHIDEIVRIRAIQSFSPADSVGCLFALKGIVRDVVEQAGGKGLEGEMNLFDRSIDEMVLLAFDNYMACRETLFEIRVKELKEMVAIQTGNAWKKAADGGRKAPNQERTAEGQS